MILGFEAQVAKLDRSDPAGDLPLDILLGRWSFTSVSSHSTVESVEAVTASEGRFVNDQRDPSWELLKREGAPPEDLRRRYARVALKRLNIPERMAAGPDGEPLLEVMDAFTWRPFDFDAEPWPEALGSQ